MKQPKAFTLVELIVVMAISLLLVSLGLRSLSNLIGERKYENAVNSFYAMTSDQLLQTVLLQNRTLVITVSPALGGAYSLYSESPSELPAVQLRGTSVTQTGSLVQLSIQRINKTSTESTGILLQQNLDSKAGFATGWTASGMLQLVGSGSILADQKALSDTEWYLADSSGMVQSGKLVFRLFNPGEAYGSVLLQKIEAKDFWGNAVLPDMVEIRYSPKGKKTFTGYIGSTTIDLKSVKIIFTDDNGSKLSIDLQ